MQKNKLLVVALGALFALPALAKEAAVAPASAHTVTSNIGFVSNYVFRGISQTSTKPAIQGGVDYGHASGFYAGIWGSNVSWIYDSGAVATGSVKTELDTYFGYKGGIVEDVSYDVGFVRYNYLGGYTAAAPWVKADTSEIYGAISYKFLTAKYSYSVGNGFLTIPDSKGTNYIELKASHAIGETGVIVGASVGKQTYKGDSANYVNATASGDPTYTDYKVSVAKDISGYVLGLAYTKTDASPFYTWPNTGGDWGRGMTAVSLTRSF